MRTPLCPFSQHKRLFPEPFLPVYIHGSDYLKDRDSLSFHLGSTLGIFFNTKRELLFSFLFTNDLFLGKNAPQDTANRQGQKSLAGAGTLCLCRSNTQGAAGGKRRKAILLQGCNHRACWGRAPTEHHVGQETQPRSTGHCQQEALFFGVTAGQWWEKTGPIQWEKVSFRVPLSNEAQRSENGDVQLGGGEGKQKSSPKALKKSDS